MESVIKGSVRNNILNVVLFMFVNRDLVGQADIIWDAMSLTDVNSIDNEK